ncbi:Predicted pyridoxamine-phosphate oxidase [Desulfosarcina cetonica]|nr:Predicted pyridoxamine-phosphate oxidase [Desulfosarcina cetonica]
MTKKKDSLEHVLQSVWALLGRGAAHFSDPFNRPALATGHATGCGVRTVILRQADADGRQLICYADLRSPKIGEIKACGRAQWLFYHPRKMVQVRISGRVTVHSGDATAEAFWKRVKGLSRLNYCAEQPPGSPLDQPSAGLSARLLKDLPNLMDSNAGRDHFAVIIGRVETIDWLRLRPSGNVRARFQWEDGHLQASWVVP